MIYIYIYIYIYVYIYIIYISIAWLKLSKDKKKSNLAGFRNGKGSTDHLVRASFLILTNTLGSEPCWKRKYQFIQFILSTYTFSPIATDETF